MTAVTHASGIGSWPGTDVREAIVTTRDLLLDAEAIGIPYAPETPARGPGADLIGRGAGLLRALPVDLQPSGWRFVDRPGKDAARTAALHRHDLDELAEAYDGYTGPLKLQVAGPWTLAASLQLNRGERAVSDPGATRDLIASLTEGIAAYSVDVRRLVPGAEPIVQLDEPSLPAVLAGVVPTASGYGRLRAVDAQVVAAGLRSLIEGQYGSVVIHCCHRDAPIPLLRSVGASALALDLTAVGPARWESVAASLEAGLGLYAGVLPSEGTANVESARRLILDAFERVGLAAENLGALTITPACGLASSTVAAARHTQRSAVDLARDLTEEGAR